MGMQRKPRHPLRGGWKAFYQISWPAAGDSASNPSRVNRDTWVPARESRLRDRAERLFQAQRALQKEGWVGGRMDLDTRHSTGHCSSAAGRRFGGGNPVEKF